MPDRDEEQAMMTRAEDRKVGREGAMGPGAHEAPRDEARTMPRKKRREKRASKRYTRRAGAR